MFLKIGVLKKFANFIGKHLCLSRLKACNFIKKKLQHKCFPVDILKFLRTPILKNIYEWLLLILGYRLTSAATEIVSLVKLEMFLIFQKNPPKSNQILKVRISIM